MTTATLTRVLAEHVWPWLVQREYPRGTFLHILYDWRWPTWSVITERMSNPDDPHILTPHVFGWGWSINLYQLFHRLSLVRGS
jgi:hypothetical protein